MTDNAPSSAAPASPSEQADELRCPACDYDLRGLAGERCPECGLVFDRAALSISQIPWTHREKMGRLRAFRATCRLVIFHPKRIAADVGRPVSFADAKRFQRLIVLMAFVPLLLVGLYYVYQFAAESRYFQPLNRMTNPYLAPAGHAVAPVGNTLGFFMEGGGVILAAVCLWLSLKAITGVASYFFHPKSLSVPRQNRAIAISYYGCAAVAWTPMLVAIYGVATLLQLHEGLSQSSLGRQLDFALRIVLLAGSLVLVGAWWISTLRLLKWTTRCGAVRQIAMAISLPILCPLCVAVICLLLLGSYFLICAVILSLLR